MGKPKTRFVMRKFEEKKALLRSISDKSRQAQASGRRALVPLKFTEDGSPITAENFNPVKHLKSLSLKDLAFLKAWREYGWDSEKAMKKMDLEEGQVKRLVAKLQVFKDEDERIKALADIPTTPWIAAKHTENVFAGNLEDSQRDSLKELAKIVGAYKPTTTVNVTASLKMPELSPEQAKAAREFFDTIAEESHAA
jgi:hypothetical protein